MKTFFLLSSLQNPEKVMAFCTEILFGGKTPQNPKKIMEFRILFYFYCLEITASENILPPQKFRSGYVPVLNKSTLFTSTGYHNTHYSTTKKDSIDLLFSR